MTMSSPSTRIGPFFRIWMRVSLMPGKLPRPAESMAVDRIRGKVPGVVCERDVPQSHDRALPVETADPRIAPEEVAGPGVERAQHAGARHEDETAGPHRRRAPRGFRPARHEAARARIPLVTRDP